jgi:diguanylate cyclase (GGDEF)-like protein
MWIVISFVLLVLLILQHNTQKKKAKTVHKLAYHDFLTDLPNRLALIECLSSLVTQQRSFSMLFLDIDRFKTINDTYGHAVGDEILIAVAKRLRKCVRHEENIYRIGGDEFVIILYNIHEHVAVADIAQRIINTFVEPFSVDARITASIGIAMYPLDTDCPQEMLKYADLAMYSSKDTGRNNYSFFSTDILESVLEASAIEHELYGAIERCELEVYYQPQINLETYKIVGVEALLRWNHPTLGNIPPTKFIPIAEETGDIIEIGEWVLAQACRQILIWSNYNLKIAVNISTVQLQRGDLCELVQKYIDKYSIDPTCLELELTESVFLKHSEEAQATLNKIIALGVTVAIDDFGTGYSSLGYLKHLTVHRIKIGRGFIEDTVLIKTIVEMAHGLSALCIVEGVETKEQLDYLRSISCDEIQGFYISKPIPANYMEEFYRHYLHKEK